MKPSEKIPFFEEKRDVAENDLALEALKQLNPADLIIAIKSELQVLIGGLTNMQDLLNKLKVYTTSNVQKITARVEELEKKISEIQASSGIQEKK